ncbi:MAG: GNAT family N-acetyltransferase [Deltaproteobacteria bacterium]|nr:GNAT family N-acetyltransferase [Deltaproteobacteria bacterium]
MATGKKKAGRRAGGKKAAAEAGPVHLRRYLPEDVNRIVAAAEAIRALDPGAPHLDAPRWRYVCADPYADSESHFRVAETASGQIVGFSYRFDPPRVEGGSYRAVYVVVHPEYRRTGIGTRLLEATLGEPVDPSRDPGWFATTTVDESSEAGRRFATKAGFKKGYTRLVMERELPGRPLPDQDVPGLKIERFVGASAFHDWASIHNEAYAGQDDAIRHDADDLEEHRPVDFRPEHVRFAKVNRERVGYLFLRETADGGHIESIGVRPKHQGRGLGRALTRAAIDYLVDRGHTRVSLIVDQGNKPALRLYTRLDFEEVGRRHYLIRPAKGR